MERKFFIGAATSAHQVEGNNTQSDFWLLEHLEHSRFVEPSGDAADHYNRYEEDIRLMAEAGLNAYRFSIEWARVEPVEGQFEEKEIEHYRKVIGCCKKYGIEPIVTLHHFSSPVWVIKKGGWGNEAVIPDFSRYAAYVAKQLGSELHYICTINEANTGYQIHKVAADIIKAAKKKEGSVQVGVRFEESEYAISRREEGEAFGCDPSLVQTFLKPRSREQEVIVMRAHQAAKQAIKDMIPDCKVGLTLSLFDYQPTEDGREVDRQLWEEDFGFYLPYFKEDDFLGVQNYSRKIVTKDGAAEPAEQVRCTQMGYEDYPASIGNVLRRVAKDFKQELLVTENGIATADDSRRCEFIKEAFSGVMQAKSEGVPVTGYCYWSLLDNFEWQAGYSKTFGLIEVDRKTQKRYPKESLKVLGELKNQ